MSLHTTQNHPEKEPSSEGRIRALPAINAPSTSPTLSIEITHRFGGRVLPNRDLLTRVDPLFPGTEKKLRSSTAVGLLMFYPSLATSPR